MNKWQIENFEEGRWPKTDLKKGCESEREWKMERFSSV